MYFSEGETRSRRSSLGLGLRNGTLMGLALALGSWALHALSLITAPVRLPYPALLVGVGALLLLGGLAGWLSALLGSTLAGGLIWSGTAVLMSLVISHVPYEGYNLVIWLADRRFWGLSIYPFGESAQVGLWLSGFFIVLILAILGLLQDYRLEGLETELDAQGRLSSRGWFSLLVPALLVFGVGLIADNILYSPLRAGPRLVHEAIRTGRTYTGDLFELSLQRGVNYNALASVRDQLSAHYSLSIAEANLGEAETVYMVADFDNGAWINCIVIAGNLSNCYDASPPYTQGLAGLISSGEIPRDCPACYARVSDRLRRWLFTRGKDFNGTPQVTRLAQRGNYVLMRAQSPEGDVALECRFHGLTPVQLEDCWEVEGSVDPTETASQDLGPSDSEPGVDTTTTSTPTPRASPTTDPALARFAPAMRPAYLNELAAVGPISQYQIKVTVDPLQATLDGQETVRYVNASPVSQEAVYLRLFPNLTSYGGEMTVSEVRVGADRVTTGLEAEGTALRVPLPNPLPPGGEATIAMDFKTTVPLTVGVGYGQLVYLQDVMALANFYPIIPTYDEDNCARFGNCSAGWNIEIALPHGDAVFSDSALYEVFVTAPQGWTVVASGSTVGKENSPEDNVTWHVVSGPMRDFNLALSPRYQVATGRVEDITVNSYYLPEDALGGRRVLDWAVEALDFYSQQFGPYPFAEFDIAATPTAAGGMEYPGLIVMPIRNYGDTSGAFQWSTVHEVAHQWWYSLVGNDQQDEPWLDEALTQYSTALFFELQLGWDAYVEEVFEPRYQRVAGTDEDDLISRPVAAYNSSNYGPIVYAKGPLFFHALRQELGLDPFLGVLRRYADTFRYKNASGPDLLGLLEAASGEDLSALYQEWLGDLD